MIGLELLRKTVEYFWKFAAGTAAGLGDRGIELTPTKKKNPLSPYCLFIFLTAGVQLLAREARHFLLGGA